jgi:hypothetical protein
MPVLEHRLEGRRHRDGRRTWHSRTGCSGPSCSSGARGTPGFALVDRSGLLWFEHWPGGVRGSVLNAHAMAVLGLRDYWQQVPSGRVRQVLEGGLTTMRLRAERYRRPGTWSWKNLVNPVAHRKYHGWHVDLLDALARASGDSWFSRLARLFEADYP